ncbi:hypothetical protein ABT317_14280, partial [Streptomyces carpinensis]
MVSTNYAPEHTGIGPYATQLAEHWAARGADTHVLAGMPHYPSWRLDPAYAGVWRTTESRGGVTVWLVTSGKRLIVEPTLTL